MRDIYQRAIKHCVVSLCVCVCVSSLKLKRTKIQPSVCACVRIPAAECLLSPELLVM